MDVWSLDPCAFCFALLSMTTDKEEALVDKTDQVQRPRKSYQTESSKTVSPSNVETRPLIGEFGRRKLALHIST